MTTNTTNQTNNSTVSTKVKSLAENTCLIFPSIHTWSGRTKARKQDYTQLSGNEKFSLPEGILTLGSKRLIAGTYLQPFEQVRREILRYLGAYGVEFTDGVYLVPMSVIKPVMETLDAKVADFERLKADYLSKHRQLLAAFAEQNPEYFTNGVDTGWADEARVADRFQCSYSICRFGNETEFDRLNNEKTVAQAQQGMYEEVKTFGQKWLDNPSAVMSYPPLCGREMQMLRDKLWRLSFIDGDVANIVNLLDRMLKPFGLKRSVDEKEFVFVRTGLRLLTDPLDLDLLKSDPQVFDRRLSLAMESAYPNETPSFDEDQGTQDDLWSSEDMEALRASMQGIGL